MDETPKTDLIGKPVPEGKEWNDIAPDGQQFQYMVLSAEERAKGYVRPLRDTYLHKPCNTTTKMGYALAETYARQPSFYARTFCCECGGHFPVSQFVWKGTNEVVGS